MSKRKMFLYCRRVGLSYIDLCYANVSVDLTLSQPGNFFVGFVLLSSFESHSNSVFCHVNLCLSRPPRAVDAERGRRLLLLLLPSLRVLRRGWCQQQHQQQQRRRRRRQHLCRRPHRSALFTAHVCRTFGTSKKRIPSLEAKSPNDSLRSLPLFRETTRNLFSSPNATDAQI